MIAAAPRLDDARRATRAHVPLVIAAARAERAAYAALPRVGFAGAVPPAASGEADVEAVLAALAARLPPAALAALAARLPVLVPHAERALPRRAATRAALAMLGGGPLAAAGAAASVAGGLDALRAGGEDGGEAAGAAALISAGAALAAGALPGGRAARAAVAYVAVAAIARRGAPAVAARDGAVRHSHG